MLNDTIYSHFEDQKGKRIHLNNSKVCFMFSDGKILFYIEGQAAFDNELKLISKKEMCLHRAKQLYEATAKQFPFIRMKEFEELKESDKELWMEEAFIDLSKEKELWKKYYSFCYLAN